MWSSRRVRNAVTTSSSPAQIRETSDFEIPESIPQCGDQVVDGSGGDAVHVGLHHHRVERLVDPTPRFEDDREERPLAELRDAELDVTGLSGQQPLPGAVAVGDPGLGALVAAGADALGGFDFDELLHDHPDRLADQVDTVTGAERLEQLRHGRLGQGHRWGSLR